MSTADYFVGVDAIHGRRLWVFPMWADGSGSAIRFIMGGNRKRGYQIRGYRTMSQ